MNAEILFTRLAATPLEACQNFLVHEQTISNYYLSFFQ